jgi:hypothetical protein
MTQEIDISAVTTAAGHIQIDGPQAPRARVDLTEQSVRQVLPGELDSRVGSVVQPPVDEPIGDELDAPDVEDAAREAVARVNPDALFDAHAYDATPVLDGQASDVLQIAFSGGVKLEASDEDAQALFTSLRLGKWVDLRVSGFVAGKAGGYAENKDGESTVTGKATVKVTDLRLQRPEDLS